MEWYFRYTVFVYFPSGINIVTNHQKIYYKLAFIHDGKTIKYRNNYTDYGHIRVVKRRS
jgi:hypothetical protein